LGDALAVVLVVLVAGLLLVGINSPARFCLLRDYAYEVLGLESTRPVGGVVIKNLLRHQTCGYVCQKHAVLEGNQPF